MNCVASVRFYVDKMLSETPGMKVLMVDAETIQMLSLVYSQSQIMEKEVFLVERLGEEHERMTHLNAIVFVRPTAANLALLKKEVNEPKYGKYYMFFSNTLNQGHLAELAEADEHEVVEQVQEYFADFFAVNRNLFHCGVSGMVRVSMLASAADRTLRESASIDRAVDGLVSVLLALKMRPVIRHCAHAPTGTPSLAAEFANAVASRIKTEDEKGDFFQFRAKSGQPPPLLLVLNRRDDPVTPLLSQWTYQAMVHELIGLDNNRVDMTRAPECREDMQQVVLAQQDDDFYAEHMYDNFGDLGASVSGLLATYQQRHQSTRQIDSIQDMQRFVEHYPEFKKMSANVAKHIAIMTYLSHIVAQRTLMPVSECEQEIACVDSLTEQRAAVLEMLANPSVRPIEKLKLSMLFALRYETHRSSREVRDSLTGAEDKDLVNLLLQWAGSAQRSGDVFRNKNKVSAFLNRVSHGLKGVENVYTQHTPLLQDILEQLSKGGRSGGLPDDEFPVVLKPLGGRYVPADHRPQQVIVFVVGGCTYEEAAAVQKINEKGDMDVILGGTSIQRFESILGELGTEVTAIRRRRGGGGAASK